MKTLKVIIISLLTTVVITSCVSNKKYQESLEARKELRRELNDMQMKKLGLTNEFENLKASSAEELQQKEIELAAKEQGILQREKRLQELESLIQDQQQAVNALHQEVCSALKCFTPDELSVEVRDGKLYVSMSDKLLFESGSDDVNNRGKEAIEMLAAVLSSSDLEIMVEGHTDNVPIHNSTYTDNWDLSTQRATSVTRIMIDKGVSQKRIIASGRGEFQPIANNETPKGRQLNRRTEIVLSPKLDKLWKLTDEGLAVK